MLGKGKIIWKNCEFQGLGGGEGILSLGMAGIAAGRGMETLWIPESGNGIVEFPKDLCRESQEFQWTQSHPWDGRDGISLPDGNPG